jgi:two-component system, cell cycle sensor histidine kinase and response regulator CckA
MDRTDFEQWKAREVARLLALVETERRYYQEMVASLPVALVVLADDRAIVSANRAFRQMFGLRSEDLRRKTIDQILISPQLIERIREVHSSHTADRSVMVDFADRALRVNIIPTRNWDDEGEVETLLMIEDTATWNAALAAPRSAVPGRSPAPVLAMPAPSDVPAITWQADVATMAFTSVSGAVESILGYPATHWLVSPRFFMERIHPEDRAATLAFYDEAIERAGDASAEFRAITSSGRVLWCRETLRVTGRRVIAGVMTDITLRKQLEEQLLTAERSDALHGLASRLAHDLNNPLMIITGYAEEMQHTLKAEDPLRADVDQILGATERISGITGQLLNYTRRLAAQPAPLDLSAAIKAMEEKIAHAAGVPVEIANGGEVWAAAEPAQFEQMILALVSADREDAKERSRVTILSRIEIIAEQVASATLPPGVYAAVTVRDNGRGLDASHRPEIFEGVLAKDAAASGIARAYSTAREWGGDIAFSSEPFHGSAFTIYLPQSESAPVEAPAPAPAAQPVPVEAPAPVEPLRETILLVEDEAGIRALVRKILKRERYNVLEAGTGEEASRVAGSFDGRIHLLLTDVMLPGVGGRELAEGLRESLPDLKVLYVSGFTDDESVRAGGFPPGSKFLQKPFTLSALVGKVREALESEI